MCSSMGSCIPFNLCTPLLVTICQMGKNIRAIYRQFCFSSLLNAQAKLANEHATKWTKRAIFGHFNRIHEIEPNINICNNKCFRVIYMAARVANTSCCGCCCGWWYLFFASFNKLSELVSLENMTGWNNEKKTVTTTTNERPQQRGSSSKLAKSIGMFKYTTTTTKKKSITNISAD